MTAVNVLRLAERIVIVTIFILMVCFYFASVLMREFGGTIASDFGWLEEVVSLLNIYLVFLTAGLALERGRQVSINSFRDGIAARTGLPLRRIIDLTGFLVSVYLVWLGWKLCSFVLAMGQKNPTLEISTVWLYLAPTVGFGLLALRFLLSGFGMYDRFENAVGEH
ncbi:TRAP transporter small permease [Martelella limonii]|uniref:TRAP transporter small permease n=1 Tax=Martelella limonii TaxID=1647649 RepID=UPI00158065C4|nr:TRAP transporter small permease [Martelella limonii]